MSIQLDQLVAHRGYRARYPENTLLSLSRALEAGMLHVELDVQLSRDRVPMVYHDESLRRVSGCRGRIYDYPASELQQMPASEPRRLGEQFQGERIAVLSDLISLALAYPQVRFYIELKEEAVRQHGTDICLEAIAEVLSPIRQQCILISFDLSALERARASGFDRIGMVCRDWSRRDQDVTRLDTSVLFINKNRIPAGPICAICPVVVYEVDTVQEAVGFLQRGAAKVESYRAPELFRESSGT
jgi:glycerophosphoryl diester phosphodiesterase